MKIYGLWEEAEIELPGQLLCVTITDKKEEMLLLSKIKFSYK